MKAKGLANWMSAIQGAARELCDIFAEGPNGTIRANIAEEALTESIFACAKRSPNYCWVPEESTIKGEFRNTLSLHALTSVNSGIVEKKEDIAHYAEQLEVHDIYCK